MRARCPRRSQLDAPFPAYSEHVRGLLAEVSPVEHPDRPLGLVIVPAKELMHARGVTRAAGIFQQQRVKEVRPDRSNAGR